METSSFYSLNATKRTPGTKSTDILRKNHKIPCVLYGPKIKHNIHFYIEDSDMERILSVKDVKCQNLHLDGQTYHTILKDTAFHPTTEKVLHADFYAINQEYPLSIWIPIILKGTPVGVLEGGRLLQYIKGITVKTLPSHLITRFEIDVSNLKIGASLLVKDLPIEHMTISQSSMTKILVVKEPKGSRKK